MWNKTVRRYLAAAAGCAVFAAVYERFSHGVLSLWMAGLPLWPLLLGAAPFALCRRWTDGARWLWHAGVMTLTTGSAVQGVLNIYGTTAEWTAAYWAAGAALLLAALCGSRRKRP